jgi:hypothetical protein
VGRRAPSGSPCLGRVHARMSGAPHDSRASVRARKRARTRSLDVHAGSVKATGRDERWSRRSQFTPDDLPGALIENFFLTGRSATDRGAPATRRARRRPAYPRGMRARQCAEKGLFRRLFLSWLRARRARVSTPVMARAARAGSRRAVLACGRNTSPLARSRLGMIANSKNSSMIVLNPSRAAAESCTARHRTER